LKRIPNNSFDLIILDLPYNLNKDFPNDNLSDKDFRDKLRLWIKQIIPTLKQSGSLYVFNGEDYLYFLKQEVLDKCLIYRNTLVWYYNYKLGDNSKYNYSNRREFILYYVKSSNYTFNQIRDPPSRSTIEKNMSNIEENGNIPYEKLSPQRRKYQKKENYERNPINVYRGAPIGNVFEIPRVARGNNPELKFGSHPTQKPEKLIEKFVLVSSNEGDLVGDFFMGSGTSCVVAKRLRRSYFGIEIKRKYYNIAKKRIRHTNKFKNILDYTKSLE